MTSGESTHAAAQSMISGYGRKKSTVRSASAMPTQATPGQRIPHSLPGRSMKQWPITLVRVPPRSASRQRQRSRRQEDSPEPRRDQRWRSDGEDGRSSVDDHRIRKRHIERRVQYSHADGGTAGVSGGLSLTTCVVAGGPSGMITLRLALRRLVRAVVSV